MLIVDKDTPLTQLTPSNVEMTDITSESSITSGTLSSQGPPPPPEKGSPPPYTDSSPQSPASTSTTFVPPIIDTPAVNFLQVSKKNSALNGSWKVDTSLTIPPFLLPPLDPEETPVRPNLFLSTENAALTAWVELVGGSDLARIKAKTKNAAITVKLLNPNDQPVDLSVWTQNARATVYLPRNFVGPVTASTSNSTITFSPEISKHLTIFSEINGTKKAFLGPLAQSQYGVESLDWSGDQLDIGTKNSGVRVFYVDELECATPLGKGWFAKLFQ